ncbi:hypothetical protein DFP72DRAFT_898943 [Ephemerocybe angulata]|uniref:Uncharacterized protein n=1 Tax=Ephemerocybe angulata TaxID=980116 RepID=A0A8H6HWA2_9AGAR|nr:hypothetical protein DFP72DRAFT_898943 [Tulosesus angulatus]
MPLPLPADPARVPEEPLDEGIEADIAKRFARALAQFNGDIDKTTEYFLGIALPWVTNVPSRASPLTTKNKSYVTSKWGCYLCIMQATTQASVGRELWWEEHVVAYYSSFVVYIAKTARVSPGTQIRARTLSGYCRIWIVCVRRYCVGDPQPDGSRRLTGLQVLKTRGVYEKLMDILHHYIFDNHLERGPKYKAYFGRGEVWIIIKMLLDSAKDDGQHMLVVIHFIIRLLFTFYGTFRPSSMGHSHDKGFEAGLFAKVGDIEIHKYGFGRFVAYFHCRNFKGSADTDVAVEKSYKFDFVLHAHNIFFDTSLWIIIAFWMRGLFAKNYPTLLDVFCDPSARLTLDPTRLDEPLFPLANPGGRGFCQPLSPVSAGQISRQVVEATGKAGLGSAGLTAFRRDAGDHFSTVFSVPIAQSIMNHNVGDAAVLESYYLEGPVMYNLTAARLGEVVVDGTPLPGAFRKHYGRNPVMRSFVDVMLINKWRSQKDPSTLEAEAKQKAARKEAQNAASAETVEAIEDLWREFRTHVGAKPLSGQQFKEPQHNAANARKWVEKLTILPGASGPQRAQAKAYLVFLTPGGSLQKAKEIVDRMEGLRIEKGNQRRLAGRKTTRKNERARTQALRDRNREVTGTREERDQVLEESMGVDQGVTDAMNAHITPDQFASLDMSRPLEELAKDIMTHKTQNEMERAGEDYAKEILSMGKGLEKQRKEDEQEEAALAAFEAELLEEEQEIGITPEDQERMNRLVNGSSASDAATDSQEEAVRRDLQREPEGLPIDGEAAEKAEFDPLKLDDRFAKLFVANEIARAWIEDRETAAGELTWTDEEKIAANLNPSVQRLICHICLERGKPRSKIGWTKSLLRRHMIQNHSDWHVLLESAHENDIWTCPGCGEEWDTVEGLKHHVHTPSTIKVCPRHDEHYRIYKLYKKEEQQYHQTESATGRDVEDSAASPSASETVANLPSAPPATAPAKKSRGRPKKKKAAAAEAPSSTTAPPAPGPSSAGPSRARGTATAAAGPSTATAPAAPAARSPTPFSPSPSFIPSFTTESPSVASSRPTYATVANPAYRANVHRLHGLLSTIKLQPVKSTSV